MTRHLTDHSHTANGTGRLVQFLRLDRMQGRHPATVALLRRRPARNPPQGRITGWVMARSADTPYARTSFS